MNTILLPKTNIITNTIKMIKVSDLYHGLLLIEECGYDLSTAGNEVSMLSDYLNNKDTKNNETASFIELLEDSCSRLANDNMKLVESYGSDDYYILDLDDEGVSEYEIGDGYDVYTSDIYESIHCGLFDSNDLMSYAYH